MSYQVVCPKGHEFTIDEANTGGSVVCPVCGERFTAMRPAAPSAPPPAAHPQWHWPHTGRGDMSSLAATCSQVSAFAGWPLVALGLFLVLFARGCDSIERRGVDRANAKAEVAQAQFEDPWNKQRMDLEKKIANLQEKENPSADDTKTIQDDKNTLRDLEKSRQKALRDFESTTLNDVKIAARDANANYRMQAYSLEILFVWGAIILAMGLLMVAAVAQGAERWIALTMIVIIVFSLFIIGFAWMPIAH